MTHVFQCLHSSQDQSGHRNGGKHGYVWQILETVAYQNLLKSTTATFIEHVKPNCTATYYAAAIAEGLC